MARCTEAVQEYPTGINAIYNGVPMGYNVSTYLNRPIWGWAIFIDPYKGFANPLEYDPETKNWSRDNYYEWCSLYCEPVRGMIVIEDRKPVFKKLKKNSETEVLKSGGVWYSSRNYTDTFEEAVQQFNEEIERQKEQTLKAAQMKLAALDRCKLTIE